jgi:1-deoxy-D-xylulose-5-phosphate synthase
LGLPDAFLNQATHQQMLIDCGLDAKGILLSIEQAWL